MSHEHNRERLHDFCTRCHSEVPYKKKRCIACKGDMLELLADYQYKTGNDMTAFADYIIYEAL